MSIVALVRRLPLPGLLHRIWLHRLNVMLQLMLLQIVKRWLLVMIILQTGVIEHLGGQTKLLLLRHVHGILLLPWVLVELLRAPLHLQLQRLRALLMLLMLLRLLLIRELL